MGRLPYSQGRRDVDARLEGSQPAQDVNADAMVRLAIGAHVSACEGREVRLDEIGRDTRARLPV